MRVSRPRLSGYIAMAAAAAICAWLIATYSGGSGLKTVKIGPSASATAPGQTTGVAPSLLTAAALAERSRSVGHPVYWAGPESRTRYDLTQQPGSTIVRYVAPASASETLRIATIPYANAYAATQQLAAAPGATVKRLPNGSLAYYREGRPAAYVVFPDANYVIEVNAPSTAEARRVALSGRVAAINP
jgi:hypothetical protein